jgi:hypothetical protein
MATLIDIPVEVVKIQKSHWSRHSTPSEGLLFILPSQTRRYCY